ncbi:MAG: aat [Frankiales bacterium]|nr:aat [Frankiales bacterium]
MNVPLDPAAFFAGLDVVGAPRELVALGGTLEPETLVAAYRHGCFPWPSSGPEDGALIRSARRLAHAGRVPVLPGSDGLVPWCSPEPRAVLLPSMLRISRSLRRRLRSCGWETSVDVAFGEVMAGCAAREETWITGRMREAYTALHELGGAHSVEVWDGDRLIGGLYGVLTGGVFSGESMFHRQTDASKVALVALVDRMREGGIGLLDTQQATDHMASLGQVQVSRSDYVDAVRTLRDRPTALPPGRRPVGLLAPAHEDEAAVVR